MHNVGSRRQRVVALTWNVVKTELSEAESLAGKPARSVTLLLLCHDRFRVRILPCCLTRLLLSLVWS